MITKYDESLEKESNRTEKAMSRILKSQLAAQSDLVAAKADPMQRAVSTSGITFRF